MGWPFTIVYTLLIIGAIYFTMVTVPNKLNSHDWPKTIGEVTSSEVVKKTRRTKTSGLITIYSAKVSYQYTVNGSIYKQQETLLADHHTDAHIKEAIHNSYAPGVKRNVYYNPNKPSIASLERSLTGDLIATGLFFLISIGAMAFSLYRNARKRR